MSHSFAFIRWKTERAKKLDDIERAHQAVGGSKRGRRFATEQLNSAYTILLVAQFQGYCRDLYREAVDAFVLKIPLSIRDIVAKEFLREMQLVRGNATKETIQRDFQSLGIVIWIEAKTYDSRIDLWLARLDRLNKWRNAIAHQDFDPVKLSSQKLSVTLPDVQKWRRGCGRLATTLDRVMKVHLTKINNQAPW